MIRGPQSDEEGKPGAQIAGLLTALASVLQQSKQDEALDGIMQDNVKHLPKFGCADIRANNVLKEIEAAVEKRLRPNREPLLKRDRLCETLRKKAKGAKHRRRDPDKLEAAPEVSKHSGWVPGGANRSCSMLSVLKSCLCVFRYPPSFITS
jgi:hypothetical protein